MRQEEKRITMIKYFAAIHITAEDIRSIHKSVYARVVSSLSQKEREDKEVRTLYVLFTALALLRYQWPIEIIIDQVKSGKIVDVLCNEIMIREETSSLNQFIADVIHPEKPLDLSGILIH